MNDTKIKIAAIILLTIVFLLVAWNSIMTITKKRSVYSTTTTSAVIERAVREGMMVSSRPDLIKKDAKGLEWGRDPFQRYEVHINKAEDASSLKLMGITASAKGKPIAVLNNEMVSVGSHIGKFEVVSIEKDSVVVTDGKQKFTLKMQ